MYKTRLCRNLEILRSELAAMGTSRFAETRNFIQHGHTSVYTHCISVAYTSCMIAARFNLKVDIPKLVRGALLHDYFLYDWHNARSLLLHGFTHPKRALVNACEEFRLSPLECNIISRHMFPLTPIPPLYMEGWIVNIADKYCFVRESFAGEKSWAA